MDYYVCVRIGGNGVRVLSDVLYILYCAVLC
jgi:hypothetical protein